MSLAAKSEVHDKALGARGLATADRLARSGRAVGRRRWWRFPSAQASRRSGWRSSNLPPFRCRDPHLEGQGRPETWRGAASERPLLLAGFEAARAGAGPALARVAGTHGVPVLTTYKAKGVLDEHHHQALGGAGLSPAADRVLLELVARADLVLLVGYDPVEMRLGWLDPFPVGASVIELTTAPADHAMHRVDRCLIGPVGPLLAVIFDGVAPGAVWPSGEPRRARAGLAACFAPPAAWDRKWSSRRSPRCCPPRPRSRSTAVPTASS